MKLSIVIPCYNEEATLEKVLDAVIEQDLAVDAREVIVVDDGSHDKSVEIAARFANAHPEVVRVVRQSHNMGKGAAIRAGFDVADGGLVVIQDADLEYNPADLPLLLSLFEDPSTKVVYGSRRLTKNPISDRFYYSGAKTINTFSNILYQSRISDQFTCYKMFRQPILTQLNLTANGFDIESEITAKLLKAGVTIHEVPITYQPRNRAAGKKIHWRDGIACVQQLLKHRF